MLCIPSHLILLQNAGANRDVCHQVSVKLDGHDNVCLNAGVVQDLVLPDLAQRKVAGALVGKVEAGH